MSISRTTCNHSPTPRRAIEKVLLVEYYRDCDSNEAVALRGPHKSANRPRISLSSQHRQRLLLPRRLGVHVGAQYGVDPRLVASLLAEPVKQVGIKPHGHDLLAARQHDFCTLPELFVGRMYIRIGFDTGTDGCRVQAIKTAPIGAAPSLLGDARSLLSAAGNLLGIARSPLGIARGLLDAARDLRGAGPDLRCLSRRSAFRAVPTARRR